MDGLTIEVSDRVAEAIGTLDKPLKADDVSFSAVLRWATHEVGGELIDMSESDLDPVAMRHLAKRIEVLADAAEAVA